MLYILVFGMMAGGCIDVVHFGVWNDGRWLYRCCTLWCLE